MKLDTDTLVTDPRMRAQTPRARRDGLLVEDLDDETLVYDLHDHRAHCLNRSAAAVWRSSDGATRVSDMARLLSGVGLPEDEAVVWMALSRLEAAGLLDEPVRLPTARRRFSRKDVLRVLGVTAGFGLLLPAVTSITAPLAAQAASCIPAAQCASASVPNCTQLPICENRTQCCHNQGAKKCRANPC